LSEDNFVVVRDRKMPSYGSLKLTQSQKKALEQKYASGDRFPMQLMSLDYVAQHTYEPMRAKVDAEYRWLDSVLRSVSASMCATPNAIENFYNWMRVRQKKNYKKDSFTVAVTSLKASLSKIYGKFMNLVGSGGP
jgi:hypothetical protein